ncbi:uncharacterized protein LOC131996227 [Stomoxys calcitrans]|uniref:uncharacterized protein LOC131996227 n=1 Tax=Stomoxys calcitrans TaxID=35570 RepID=UPI0027E3228C|nr:uncharacterized protein LOC131996227 [Stomoxys calcitrans]
MIQLGGCQAAKRRFVMEVHNCTCIRFSSPSKLFECEYQKLTKGRYSISLMFELERALTRQAEIELQITYRVKQGRTIVTFTNVKLKVCDVLTHAQGLPVIKDLMESFNRCSNLPIMCPILGNKMYNITNVIVNEELFPPYTQFMDFNFTVNFYDNGKLFSTYKLEGSTVKRS